MKKVVLGTGMFLAGIVAVALLLAGSMANEWTVNGEFSAFWNLTQYGLIPFFYGFLAVAAIGLAVAVWGLVQQK